MARKKEKKIKIRNINQQKHLQKLFLEAQQLQQSGYISEAEKNYHQILEIIPGHPDASHFLGLIKFQTGEIKEAEKLIWQSIKSEKNPFYLSNYGLILGKKGLHEEAIKYYKKAIKINPEYAEAWYNMGVSYSSLGDMVSSESSYKSAVSINKNYVKALYNLAGVLEVQGKTEEVKNVVNSLQDINPDSAEIYMSLATALQKIGGHNNISRAQEYLNKLIEINPGSIEYLFAYANILKDANKIHSAIDLYKKIIALESNYQEVRVKYAECMVKTNQFDVAMTELSDVLKKNPDNINALLELGHLYRALGEFSSAEELYNKVLEIDVKNNSASVGLTFCKKIEDKNDILVNQLNEITRSSNNISAWFSLGKIYDDLGEYDAAFQAYDTGNKLKNKKLEYDKDLNSNKIDRIIDTFDTELISRLEKNGDDSSIPVFIFGSPRSGTTLIEQIISSHHRVYGAGELDYIPEIANKEYSQHDEKITYPEKLKLYINEDIKNDASIYLKKINNYINIESIKHVTDKLPGNFLYLGYIAILFKNAKLIYCKRHPLDTCISMYFQLLESENQFCFNLENLGYWYKDYSRLMKHWENLLGEKIITINYSDMINDFEDSTRKLINDCELDWDENCKEFYKSKREIKTFSQWQVRQPIYKTSIDRWKKYERHIEKLKEILDGYY